MPTYELTEATIQDLESIFAYTIQYFGRRQAKEYLSNLEIVFNQLAENFELERIRPEIRQGLRSMPFKNHMVFYWVVRKRVRIVRIRHASRDLPDKF